MPPSVTDLLSCPMCRADALAWADDLTPLQPPFDTAEGMRCGACKREYPHVDGVWVMWSDTIKRLQLEQAAAAGETGNAPIEEQVKRANIAVYDTISDSYGEHHDGALSYTDTLLILKSLATDHLRLEGERSRTIVDVGCAAGVGITVGAHGYDRVVGVDLSLQNLRAVAAKGVVAVLADAERLPFREGAVHLVTCFATLHHLPDPAGFVAEAERALAHGGVLMVAGEPTRRALDHRGLGKVVWEARKPIYRNLARFSDRFFLHANKEQQRLNDLAEHGRTHGGLTPDELEGWFARAGFVDRVAFHGIDRSGSGAWGMPGWKMFVLKGLSGQNPLDTRNWQNVTVMGRKAPAQKTTAPAKVWLSPPHMTEDSRAMLLDAYDSGWIAPIGPHLNAFEEELAERAGVAHACGLSCGTAALHLALELCGVARGDEVFVSTLTFVASASPVVHLGAAPVFIDSERRTWNMDPARLEEALEAAKKAGRLPKAVVAVDLYGQLADYEAIEPICERYGVPLIEDAAEALGASFGGRPAGSFGRFGVFSFNGNKIITTSSGGVLLSNDGDAIAHARKLATQARDPAPHYQHSEIGYNYRLSNLLAAVGRGQLRTLDSHIATRREHRHVYSEALAELPGVQMMPVDERGESNAWLTCLTIDPKHFGVDREHVRQKLEAEGLESRPVWKPMHLQPVFADARTVGGEVAADLFEHGLCLPSGSSLDPSDRARVIDVIHSCRVSRARSHPSPGARGGT